ncbi:hypothetical protein OY671_013114, partial [Metschnikowia pulcherrima]
MRNGASIDVHSRYTQQSSDASRQIGGSGGTSTYDAQGRGARATPGRKPITNSPLSRAVCLGGHAAVPSRGALDAAGHFQHGEHLQQRHRQQASGQLALRADDAGQRGAHAVRRRRMRQSPAGRAQ